MNECLDSVLSLNVSEPMRTITIAAISERFPQFRLALIVARDLKIKPERSPSLERMIDEAQLACRARWSDVELSAIPGVAAWRSAYRGFGVSAAHSATQVLFYLRVHVEANLFFKFTLTPAPTEQAGHPRQCDAHTIHDEALSGARNRATISAARSQLCVSFSSCFRPAAVME